MSSPRAIILAAGLGTRLRPVTEQLPKPLVPVADRSLLENVLLNLKEAGIEEVAVNTHHLPERMAAFVEGLSDASQIQLFHEPEILGTGGALVNAREFLSESDCFLLHNGDVLTDLDLSQLIAEHQQHLPLATMVLTAGHENKVLASSDGVILDILGKVGAEAQEGSRLLTYTGIAAISPRIFDYLPPEGPASLPAALIAAIRSEPGCVRALCPQELYWNDIGTLQRYLQANRDVLEGKLELPLSPAASGLELLVEQGSDRKFFRMPAGEKSYVLMFSPPEDPDNRRYIEIGKFLGERELGSPQIIASTDDAAAALLEDLGDDRLFDLVRDEQNATRLESLYSRVVSFGARLAVRGTADLAQCPAANSRALDYEQLRWETDYFRENFLERMLGFGREDTAPLDAEFDALARAVEQQPYVFMHRDFQSQNIIIKDGQVRIVDFQGARRGPLAYDLASLLKDAYVELPAELRGQLREQYREELARLGGPEITADEFRRHFVLAGLQRNMQALGAFGFLSLVKGKQSFKRFVDPGLRRLRQGLDEMHEIGDPIGPMTELERLVAKAGKPPGN
jgi:aminoglycoside/choline kinase family phosphotransferase/choline kinase